MVTISQLEDEMASRIAALASDDFVQNQEVWHESEHPLTAVEDSQGRAHLAFSVSIENAPVRDTGQGHEYGALDVLADMVVIFVYKIRPTKQRTDNKLASEAARRIVAAIMGPCDVAVMIPRNAYKPGPIVDGFMPVEMRFQASFELPI